MDKKHIFIYKKDNLYGLINPSGICLCEARYKKIEFSTYGLFLATTTQNEYCYLTSSGETMSEEHFTDANIFYSPGLACCKKHKYGFISTTGEVVIPYEYDSCEKRFDSNNIIIAMKNNHYGLIDSCGKIICDFVFDKLERLDSSITFDTYKDVKKYFCNRDSSSNESKEIFFAQKGSRYGLVNKNGYFILDTVFDCIEGFCDTEYLVASNGDNCKTELMNENTFRIIQTGSNHRILNYRGEYIQEDMFDDVIHGKYGLSIIVKDNKYGILKSDGQILIRPKFSSLRILENNMFAVKHKGLWGIIDRFGRFVNKPKHLDIFASGRSDIAIAQSPNGKWGYIYTNSSFWTSIQYDWCGFINNDGFAVVQNNGKYIIIGGVGLSEFSIVKYDYIELFEEQCHGYLGIARIGKKYGLVSTLGEFAEKLELEELLQIECQEVWVVKLNGMYGVIDKNFNWIMELQQNEICYK